LKFRDNNSITAYKIQQTGRNFFDFGRGGSGYAVVTCRERHWSAKTIKFMAGLEALDRDMGKERRGRSGQSKKLDR